MAERRSRIFIAAESTIGEPLLASLFGAERCRRFHALSEIPRELAGDVLVLTSAQARTILTGAANGFAAVIWLGRSERLAPPLLHDPRVAGVLDADCPPDTVQATFRSALRLAARSDEARATRMFERVLEIGRALASEKDLDALLNLILAHARVLTHADGASIYTRDDEGKLYFRLWQNASTGARQTGAQKTLVGESSIAGFVARTGQALTLDDAYAIPESAPYRFNPASDRSLEYRTKSVLTVPLTNKADEIVGVLQLINRKDDPEILLRTAADVDLHVLPFDDGDRAVAHALAGQAGVAIENSMLYADIERLFEGFIKASVQAIEARDPATAGHSFRVAGFTERLAVAVDRCDLPGLRDILFTREQLRELRYASLLHDFGKVGVREHVLVKAKKLHPHQLELLQARFRYARARLEGRAYRALLALHEGQRPSPEESNARRREIERGLASDRARLDEFLRLVLSANEPSVSAAAVSDKLRALLAFTFPGEDGKEMPLLEEFEFADLALAQGSLNAEERGVIESHVSHTYAFLRLIPWTKNLARLPDIAYAHHEKLDGSGYPRKLAGPVIPVQSRIMTVADIFDALTAGDRPYKRSLPADKALDILESEAAHGKIDSALLRVFIESEAFRSAPPDGGQS
jgi:HD-GYP domain-containing protein (c-di-GMP phosphodiesterase class II)